MPRKIVSPAGLWLRPCTESRPDDGTVAVEDMRAVAMQGALAAAADASPAALVSLWAYDGRLHRDRPCRGR